MRQAIPARARRLLIGAAQRAQRIDPELLFYSAFDGQFADSPRAIYEYAEPTSGLRHVWRAAPKHSAAFPPALHTVVPGTWSHAREAARAKYVITNTWLGVPKVRRTVWLQTWHGTPLKRIAFDVVRDLSDEARRFMTEEVGKWDYLLSPNAFSTEIFRSAFRFDGQILETGYPRNDLLSSPERERLRSEVRTRLGIEDGRTAVLYAPTWRDGASSVEPLPMDIPALADAFARDHILLVRLHRGTPTDEDILRHPFIVNVTQYPDIRDLYLAADVLVTDYSSVMFDFAITGKPMIFYTYDLDEYRDRTRGFYFDLEAEAPGPIALTSDELAAILADVPGSVVAHADAYERFRRRYCTHDDGWAAKRVVEALLLRESG
jgi:CDP-glycerol glycerophosphotransferase